MSFIRLNHFMTETEIHLEATSIDMVKPESDGCYVRVGSAWTHVAQDHHTVLDLIEGTKHNSSRKGENNMAKRVFTTGKTLSGGQTSYRKWDDWDIGDLIVCKFVSEGYDAKYKKPKWNVLVETAHFEKTTDAKKIAGKAITLNSTGQLDKAMRAGLESGDIVEDETYLQITYGGKAEMPSGPYKGKDAHLIEVKIANAEGEAEEGAATDEEEETDTGAETETETEVEEEEVDL